LGLKPKGAVASAQSVQTHPLEKSNTPDIHPAIPAPDGALFLHINMWSIHHVQNDQHPAHLEHSRIISTEISQ